MEPKATYKTSFSSSLSSPPSLSIMKQPPSLLPALVLCYNCLCTEHGGPLLCCINNFGAFSTSTLEPFCLLSLTFTFTLHEIGVNLCRKCAEKYPPSLKSTCRENVHVCNLSNVCTQKKGRSVLERRKST